MMGGMSQVRRRHVGGRSVRGEKVYGKGEGRQVSGGDR